MKRPVSLLFERTLVFPVSNCGSCIVYRFMNGISRKQNIELFDRSVCSAALAFCSNKPAFAWSIEMNGFQHNLFATYRVFFFFGWKPKMPHSTNNFQRPKIRCRFINHIAISSIITINYQTIIIQLTTRQRSFLITSATSQVLYALFPCVKNLIRHIHSFIGTCLHVVLGVFVFVRCTSESAIAASYTLMPRGRFWCENVL